MPTTYGGHMWVFDRDSLEPLGRVTTGVGGRPAYLTLDGRSLFASAGSKTYRWDAEDLGRRFGRPR